MTEHKVFLKPQKEESLLRFHPWVFSGAIQSVEGKPEEGDVVEVYGANGRFLGVGHYQIGSIAVRILSFQPTSIDTAFWEKRIQTAYELRQALRLVNTTNNNTYRRRRQPTRLSHRHIRPYGSHASTFRRDALCTTSYCGSSEECIR